ncbi:MAG: hypothetical protein HY940_05655 [Gammaproteobacteria bacterium]|nr:hypothetical protein [Gammaproteobacteria bacterium]
MLLRLIIWLLLTGVMIAPVQAQDIDPALTEARAVFLRGVDGEKRAVRDATQRFRSLSMAHPQEPVYQAYLGACITLQGRDASNNLDKRRITEEGLGKIDQALEMLPNSADQASPHSLDTLLVAANSFIHIPSFFNRHDKGKRLLQQILADRGFDGMAAGFKAATYLAAALVAHGENDDVSYRRYLDLAVSTDPEGRDGRFASTLLKDL